MANNVVHPIILMQIEHNAGSVPLIRHTSVKLVSSKFVSV
jgi:hypothetical protein